MYTQLAAHFVASKLEAMPCCIEARDGSYTGLGLTERVYTRQLRIGCVNTRILRVVLGREGLGWLGPPEVPTTP
eukprot:1141515-Pelagomonas_calceolata.AAC.1